MAGTAFAETWVNPANTTESDKYIGDTASQNEQIYSNALMLGGYSTSGSGTVTSSHTDSHTSILANDSNTLTNNGLIEDGIWIRTDGKLVVTVYSTASSSDIGNAYATATAQATANLTSNVLHNTIINSKGATINGGDAGISLQAFTEAYANANAQSYTNGDTDSAGGGAGYANSYTLDHAEATSQVQYNTITNNGKISTDWNGINLFTGAYASANEYTTVSNDGGNGTPHYNEDSVSRAWTDFNTITNTGSIITNDNGTAIYLGARAGYGDGDPNSNRAYASVDSNTITNSGILAAQGHGIELSSNSYNLDSDSSDDTWAEVDGNTITNEKSGRIYALNDGINLNSYNDGSNSGVTFNTITNKGRIIAESTGISLSADNVYGNAVNVSGVVISDPNMGLNGSVITKSLKGAWEPNDATAIRIETYYNSSCPADSCNIVSLSAPAYLAGRVLVDGNGGADLSGDSVTGVELTSGRSHSVRWAFQNDYLGEGDWTNSQRYLVNRFYENGANPWFHNYIASDVNDRNNDVYATIDPTNFASAANQLSDLSGMVSNLARSGLNKDTKATGGVWLNAQGGRTDYNGGAYTFDQQNDLYGVAVGYNNTVMNDVRMGVLAGYSNQKMRAGSAWSDLYSHSYDNRSTGGYVGATASKAFDRVVVDLGLAVGYQSHDDRRFVNDNLQWYGQSYANSSYNSVWYSPEIGVSVPFNVIDETITLAPNVRVNWTGQHIEGYTETGSNSNAKIDSRNIGVVESRIGLDLTKKVNGASLTVSGGYLNRSMTGSDSVKVTMIGDTNNVGYFYKDINAGYVKGSASINLGKNVEAAINGTFTKGGDIEGGNASGTLKINF